MTPHMFPVRVYYEDTDFSGAVYHANYLRFLERGRSELLRTLGVHHRALFEGAGGRTPFGFVVRALSIDYLAPALMDDDLRVETITIDVRGASVRMAQRILRNDAVLVTADVRIAAVSQGRAVRFPQPVRDAFARALRDGVSE